MNRLFIVLVVLVAPLNALAANKNITIALNWVPEPEFGGIYEAKRAGSFEKNGIDATIQPGGAGAPTWQLVTAGKVPFAVASADEVVIARAQGADIVAIFATYQTCPQGIMVHASRGFKSIADVFNNPGTLAMEVGLPYGKFLQQKFGFDKIKRVSYDGGIANFLADQNFSQQCFITSEPLAAKKAGSDPQVFLIADAGYNPYTGVIITSGAMIKDDRQTVRGMVAALREGWQSYLKDPQPANDMMRKINRTMDAQTFADAAAAQKPLIETDESAKSHLGVMTQARWQTLCDQLFDLKVIDKAPRATDCFSQ